jgi:hypothetical protein
VIEAAAPHGLAPLNGSSPHVGEAVLPAYADWAREAPETAASSIMVMRYPDDPALPTELRGHHVTHLRLAFSGDVDEAWELARPWRQLPGCVIDTVRPLPYRDVGTIHHEPTDEAVPAFDRNIMLRAFDHDAASVLDEHAGASADAPYLVELRAWGGALARPATVPNAVGNRDAAFSLLAIASPDPEERRRRDQLLEAMRPWATGRSFLNFAGVEDTSLDAVRRAYDADAFAEIRRLKARYDPDNTFRVNFNIPPAQG